MEVEIKRALTFAILMQNIEDKSPDYLMEKWEAVLVYDEPEWLLNPANLAKFRIWQRRWTPQLFTRKKDK